MRIISPLLYPLSYLSKVSIERDSNPQPTDPYQLLSPLSYLSLVETSILDRVHTGVRRTGLKSLNRWV